MPATDGQDQPRLTRVTANLTPRALQALQRAMEISGDSRTDVINAALRAYWILCEARKANDGRLILHVERGGARDRIEIV